MTLSTIESVEFDESTRSFGMSDARGGGGSLDRSMNMSRDEANTPNNTNSPNNNNLNRRKSENVLTRKERNSMKMSRLIVLFVLVLTGVTVTVLTSRLTTDWELQDFENHFKSLVKELNDTSKLIAENGYFATLSLTTAISTFSVLSNQTWPNVTLPSKILEEQCVSFLGATRAHHVFMAPLVTNVQAWNEYSNQQYYYQGLIQQGATTSSDINATTTIAPKMFRHQDGVNLAETDVGNTTTGDGEVVQDWFLPIWQSCSPTSPPPPTTTTIDDPPSNRKTTMINFNLLSVPKIASAFSVMMKTKGPVLTDVLDLNKEMGILVEEGDIKLLTTQDNNSPQSAFLFPIFDHGESHSTVVGATVAFMTWAELLSNSLHDGSDVITMVLKNSCGEVHSFHVGGSVTTYIGPGDVYIEEEYRSKEKVVFFGASQINERTCTVSLHLYPTPQMEANYETVRPQVYTGVVAGVFLFAAVVFVAYDCLLDLRLRKLSKAANKSATLVASLFPDGVRSRLLEDNNGANGDGTKKKKDNNTRTTRGQLRQYLNADATTRLSMTSTELGGVDLNLHSKPIADLFPNTTVLFADIAGFTAWSSVREPSQVFTLLETVYSAFDKTAQHRGVFKVETVGDCYVAVTGLPEPRDDHAIAMARFSRDCMIKMNDLTKKLELTLGPDTGDLAMRFGMHSGPVTAGVLRGDKSRFQLFGDTVNTAARIETTGIKNRIHISLETANQLISHGKQNWILPREDTVVAKGKGQMKTFWLIPSGFKPDQYKERISNVSVSKSMTERAQEASAIPALAEESTRLLRLVDWVADVMKRLLIQIEAKRQIEKRGIPREDNMIQHAESRILTKTTNTLDEVLEIVTLPMVNSTPQCGNDINLSQEVMEQLYLYVKTIATRYRQNEFHNFEHAAHVTMSVSKLLSRIVAPGIDFSAGTSSLHDHTFGITSDPLTQFAVVFSGLIHDVDHVGVPNYALMNENKELGRKYKGKSIAEQNSVDIAWALLMEPRFLALRKCIYHDVSELSRFRQLVVNTLLATDIFDKELQELRKMRWDKAFSRQSKRRTSGYENTVNRKATIVIEHLIQASDVAHTMQHWHVYQKWNERLFEEMYLAFKAGRVSKNPALSWYEGELGFYDNYIIPLAKKLKDCGVFGVSSDEYLNYANENRNEWATKGKKVVAMLVAKYADVDGEERNVVGKPLTKPLTRPSSLKMVSNQSERIQVQQQESPDLVRRPDSFNDQAHPHPVNGKRTSFLRRNSAR